MPNGMTLTDAGREILTMALAGAELHFTRGAVGDGTTTKDPQSMKALVSEKRSLPIQSIRTSSGGICECVLSVTNEGQSSGLPDGQSGFFLREYGLFVSHPATGAEVLYAYCNKGSEAGYLEGYDGSNPISFVLTLVTVIDRAQNITAAVTDSNNYVTVSRLDARIYDMYANSSDIGGVWTYGQDTQGRFSPTSWEDFKTALMGVTDIEALNARIERLEDNLAETLLKLEAKDITPDYSHYIIEDFRVPPACGLEAAQTDTFSCKINSIIAGDDSVDCDPVDGMLPGSWYTITDGINAENVQIHSISLENGIQRVIMEDTIKNTYSLDDCRMFRTSAGITAGGATGAGVRKSLAWVPDFTWKGTGSSVKQQAKLDISAGNAKSFSISGQCSISDSNAIILDSTTITNQTDKLTSVSGTTRSIAGTGLDLTAADSVSGFTLSVSQPPDTEIYFAFRTDTAWFSLNAQGLAQNFTADEAPTFEQLKASGNAATDLQGLGSVPALAGKTAQVAVGMYAADYTVAVPVVYSLAANFLNTDIQLQATQYSGIYDLDGPVHIASCNIDGTVTGGSVLNVTAQLTRQDGTKTDWLTPEELTAQSAAKIQFRAIYTVAAVNAGYAQLGKAEVIYADSRNLISGTIDAELYSLTQDWYMNVRQCRLTVRHAELDQSEISAYMCLRAAPVLVQGETLGTGTNTRKTYQMAHTDGIRYDTVRLFFDGVRQSGGYEVNTESGRITCTAPSGVIVSCSYEYGWEGEEWQAMTLSRRANLPDYELSEFRGTYPGLPSGRQGQSVCGIKIVQHMRSGHITGEKLGTATGSMKTFRLAHMVKDGVITVYSGGAVLNQRYWELQADPQYIRVSAPNGKAVTASYDWVSEGPTIYQFTGVFAE